MSFFKMKAILNIVLAKDYNKCYTVSALQMLIFLILTTTATAMYMIDTIIFRWGNKVTKRLCKLPKVTPSNWHNEALNPESALKSKAILLNLHKKKLLKIKQFYATNKHLWFVSLSQNTTHFMICIIKVYFFLSGTLSQRYLEYEQTHKLIW